MKDLITNLQIKVNEKLYLKDPNSSEVGKNIVTQGIKLINDLGFESFTFRKLATAMSTSESTIYRYFESKHKLLLYITSWYWSWMEYQMVFATNNVPSAEDRLKLTIDLLSREVDKSEHYDSVDLSVLNQIVISESSKAYLTKEVDEANKEGSFAGYKRLVARISDLVMEINPEFQQPHSLVSTIVEGIHHQKFFADHLPSLTDLNGDGKQISNFYFQIAISTIQSA